MNKSIWGQGMVWYVTITKNQRREEGMLMIRNKGMNRKCRKPKGISNRGYRKFFCL